MNYGGGSRCRKCSVRSVLSPYSGLSAKEVSICPKHLDFQFRECVVGLWPVNTSTPELPIRKENIFTDVALTPCVFT